MSTDDEFAAPVGDQERKLVDRLTRLVDRVAEQGRSSTRTAGGEAHPGRRRAGERGGEPPGQEDSDGAGAS